MRFAALAVARTDSRDRFLWRSSAKRSLTALRSVAPHRLAHELELVLEPRAGFTREEM
jgi:hypothetical protein